MLRLRRLRLEDQDLVPLLRLLEAKGLSLALEAVDVKENRLSEPLEKDLEEILRLLSFLRKQPVLPRRRDCR